MKPDGLEISHVFFLYSVKGLPGGFPLKMKHIIVDAFGQMRAARNPDVPTQEDVPVFYWGASDSEEFRNNLARIREWAEDPEKDCLPLIHLYMHGNEDGFGGDSLLMRWTELNDELSAICKAADGNLILVLSSCFGDSVVMKLLGSWASPRHFPYFGFISACGKLGVDDGLHDYENFYRAFFSTNPSEALNFNHAIDVGFGSNVAKHSHGYVIDRTQDLFKRLLAQLGEDLNSDGISRRVDRMLAEANGTALSKARLFHLLEENGPASLMLLEVVPPQNIQDSDERALRAIIIDRTLAKMRTHSDIFFGESLRDVGVEEVDRIEKDVLTEFDAYLATS